MEDEDGLGNRAKGSNLLLFVLGGLILLAILAFGISSYNQNRNVTALPTGSSVIGATDEASPLSTEATEEVTNGETIEMEAGSFYFTPGKITAKKDEKITIELTAKDMMHNFNIDEFDIKSETVKAGETTTIEFTPDKVGTFEYYCNVSNHRANGQVGTLVVTD